MQYTIQKGDTLSKIARQNNTTVEALAARNNIKNPNRIYAGDTLILGEEAAESAPAYAEPTGFDAFQQGLLGLSAPVYTPPDANLQYAAAANSYRAALDSAYARERASLEAQARALSAEYEKTRKNAYANARLSAIGNNEAMASLGLAGSLYSGPLSGASESGRIRQDAALRANLSEADRQEQAAKDTIAQKIVEAGYTKDAELAKWLAELYVAQAAAEQQAAKDAYSAASDQYKTRVGLLESLFKNAIAQGEYDLKAAKENAKPSPLKSGKNAKPYQPGSPSSGLLYSIMKGLLGGGGTAVNMTK